MRKITFTGSTPVGKYLARESAETLKKLSLELGGNAPFIVFDDADLDAAVTGLLASKFRNGGQTCVCPNRVYVQSGVYEKFGDMLAKRVAALKVAPATDPDAQIGPMINARAIDKIARHVDDAVAQGARVLAGGKRLTALGPNYYAPTVLADATPAMQLSCEETFGPVVPLFRFDDEAEAIRAANDTPFGLASYFYSQDMRRIDRVSRGARSGHRRHQRRRARERSGAVRRREGIGLRPRRIEVRPRRLPVDQVSLPGRSRMSIEAYPIEVTFPDISAHEASDSGIAYVHTFDSGVAGPHVMINALTHGNEVCGAIVVDALLRAKLRPRRGRLTLAFANVAAYRELRCRRSPMPRVSSIRTSTACGPRRRSTTRRVSRANSNARARCAP